MITIGMTDWWKMTWKRLLTSTPNGQMQICRPSYWHFLANLIIPWRIRRIEKWTLVMPRFSRWLNTLHPLWYDNDSALSIHTTLPSLIAISSSFEVISDMSPPGPSFILLFTKRHSPSLLFKLFTYQRQPPLSFFNKRHPPFLIQFFLTAPAVPD